MAIIYLFHDAGFSAADTVSGRTAYAYPSSDRLKEARRDPVKTALAMMAQENAFTDWQVFPELAADIRAQDAVKLDAMMRNPTHGIAQED